MMGQLVGLAIQLGIAQALAFMDHRERVRGRQNLGFELPGNGQLGGISRGAVVEVFQQQLAFGGRDDRQCGQWRQRCLLQGIGQVDQGRVHIVADPLRADCLRSQDTQGEVFTQVIHRQGQWVVAALFAAEDLDALPGLHGLFGNMLRGTVPVVEQAAEQRRRCGHAAATLGQGQGGIFMAEQRGQPRVGRLDPGTYALLTHGNP